MTTSVDTQWDTEDEWMKVLAPSLPSTDLLFVNEDEARMLSGHSDPESAARTLRGAGAKTVCVKLGPRGCAVFAEDMDFTSPGFSVDAVDSTGAGDCFSAGYIAATAAQSGTPGGRAHRQRSGRTVGPAIGRYCRYSGVG